MLSAEAHAIEQGVGSNPADTLNLNEYANSELSQGKNGAFVYQLVFEGIDSKEIREAVRQELDDSRFGWDTHALLNGVQGGKLVIERLSAIKASILVNRLKRLPLKIKWQQFSITELDS